MAFAALIIVLVVISNTAGINSAPTTTTRRTPPRFVAATTSRDDGTRNQAYTAYFSNFASLANEQLLSSTEITGDRSDMVQVPPNEGTVGMYFKLKRGKYLTTVLSPSLASSRKTVLSARSYDFDITLTLKQQVKSAPSVTLGARVKMDDITQQYFAGNPKLVLRWPVEWTSLSQQYADSQGRLVFDAEIVVRNPVAEPRPTPNWNEQRPIDPPSFQIVEQRPIDSFPMIEQRPIGGGGVFSIEQRPVGQSQVEVEEDDDDDDDDDDESNEYK